MIDHNAFIRAILDRPADDGPRLVYADWLEEQGEADRAEFIRLQCELAMMPPESLGEAVWYENGVANRGQKLNPVYFGQHDYPYEWGTSDCGHKCGCWMGQARSGGKTDPFGPCPNNSTVLGKKMIALRDRERALWIDGLLAYAKPSHWPELVLHRYQDQPGWTPHEPEGYARRGFIEEILCSWPDWLAHADAIRAAQPVTQVRLTTWITPNVIRSARPMTDFEIMGRMRDKKLEWIPAMLDLAWPGIAFELSRITDFGGHRVSDR